MQRATATRGLAAGPDGFDERSRYNSLSTRGRSSGWLCAEEGPTNDDFEGACPVERKFLLEGFVIGAFAQSLSDCGGCVVYPYPVTDCVFGAAEKRVRESRVASVYASNCEGVLFTHELVGALLPFSGEIAIGEMVAVKALVCSAVGAIENGEGEARKASDIHFVESEACRGSNRVTVGVFDLREVFIPVILVFVADHGQHLCHGVVYAFDTPVTGRVVGACREFVYTQEFVDGCRELCAELKSVVG